MIGYVRRDLLVVRCANVVSVASAPEEYMSTILFCLCCRLRLFFSFLAFMYFARFVDGMIPKKYSCCTAPTTFKCMCCATQTVGTMLFPKSCTYIYQYMPHLVPKNDVDTCVGRAGVNGRYCMDMCKSVSCASRPNGISGRPFFSKFQMFTVSTTGTCPYFAPLETT